MTCANMNGSDKRVIFQKSVIKKVCVKAPNKVQSKPIISNIFENEDDDSEDHTHKVENLEKNIVKSFGSSITLKRSVKELNKALQEDANVFEYDNVYDDMLEKKSQHHPSLSVNTNSGENKQQPKYMGAILEAAAFRKRENDRRMERKIQKERELEDPELAEKEAFVTETYRKKLEERQEEDDYLRQKEQFDEKYAADKQNNMAQFYRHLIINQRMTCNNELNPTMSEQNSTNNFPSFISRIKNKHRNIREIATNYDNNDVIDDNVVVSNDSNTFNSNNVISEDKTFNSPTIPSDQDDQQQDTNDNNVNSESRLSDENIQQYGENIEKSFLLQKSLGIKIYEKRNTDETIHAARMRYLERKTANLLQHYLSAAVDNDDIIVN